MTLPNKPWTVFRDGSANTIKDSLGQAIAYVPDYRVAEHIVEWANNGQKLVEEANELVEEANEDRDEAYEDRDDAQFAYKESEDEITNLEGVIEEMKDRIAELEKEVKNV